MSGDLEFARLVEDHYGSLYRFAFSLTHSEADACDLVQETFYIWARKGSQLRQEAKVKSWLFTTLHREHLQSQRRGTRFPQVELSETEHELPDSPEQDFSRFDGLQLAKLIPQLDPSFRAALSLFYLEDLSYEEISRTLELPLGTVKSRLSRGVAHLRLLVADDVQAQKGTTDE